MIRRGLWRGDSGVKFGSTDGATTCTQYPTAGLEHVQPNADYDGATGRSEALVISKRLLDGEAPAIPRLSRMLDVYLWSFRRKFRPNTVDPRSSPP
jgi:hypothetical protein